MADYTNTRRLLAIATALTTNSTTPAFDWLGGQGLLIVEGTLGGATITLQYSLDVGVTWSTLDSTVVLTALSSVVFNLPAGKIRAVVSGGTAASLTIKAKKL